MLAGQMSSGPARLPLPPATAAARVSGPCRDARGRPPSPPPHPPPPPQRSATEHIRVTALISQTLDAIEGDSISLGELVDRLEQRGFGVLILFLSLPAFIPIPGVAGITGPVIALLGLQMLIGLRRPWLPGPARRKRIGKVSFARFTARMARVLKVLERFCRPRITWLFDNAGNRASGLMLVLYGLLLSLPIPFTNYLFGLILLAIAIALLERDGLLLLSSWCWSARWYWRWVLWRNLRASRLRRYRRKRRNGNGNGNGIPVPPVAS